MGFNSGFKGLNASVFSYVAAGNLRKAKRKAS